MQKLTILMRLAKACFVVAVVDSEDRMSFTYSLWPKVHRYFYIFDNGGEYTRGVAL